MASERGYEGQTSPRSGPGPVLTSPDQFGAGVGAAAEQLGNTIHATELRAYQIQRRVSAEQQDADFAHKFAAYRLNLDDQVRELRANAQPGGDGHTAAVQKVADAGRDGLLAGITEDSVRRKAAEQLDTFSARLAGQEGDWQEGQRVGKQVVDTKATLDLSANRVRRNPGSMADELNAGYGLIDGMRLDPQHKAEFGRTFEGEIASAHVRGVMDTNPKAAAGLLDSGKLDAFLSPAQIEHLKNEAGVEVRRVDAQAEHAQAVAKAGFNQQVATAREAASQGIAVDDATLGVMIKQAQAIGDPKTVLELQGMQADNRYARVYQGQTPVQREQRMAQLAGQKNLPPERQHELDWLRKHGSSLDSQFNGDPVGYFAKWGQGASAPPPLNMADPNSLHARAEWAQRQSQASVATGGPPVPVFSDNELVPMRAQVASGNSGRMQVMQLLDGLASFDRAQAARQIAPSDKAFQHEAQLSPDMRATVRAGQELLTAQPQFLKPNVNVTGGNKAKAVMDHAGWEADFALRRMDPADAAVFKDNAGAFLARQLQLSGRSINDVTAVDIRQAQVAAMGSYRVNGQLTGGIGYWNTRNKQGYPFAVPEGMTAQGFQNVAQRDVLAKTHAGAGPVNPNGTPFSLGDAYPVLIASGVYQWETKAGHVIQNAKHQPYVTVIGGRR